MEFLRLVPFLGLLAMSDEQEREKNLLTHPLIVRLAEAAIIGGLVVWATVQQVEMRVDVMTRDIQGVAAQIEKLDSRLRLIEQTAWRQGWMKGEPR